MILHKHEGNPLKQVGNPLKQVGNPLEQVGNPLKQVSNPFTASNKSERTLNNNYPKRTVTNVINLHQRTCLAAGM